MFDNSKVIQKKKKKEIFKVGAGYAKVIHVFYISNGGNYHERLQFFGYTRYLIGIMVTGHDRRGGHGCSSNRLFGMHGNTTDLTLPN